MINTLKIENFILIENQTIDFDKDINVLTGDTGSGKSIIINSIRFLFGQRANSDLFLDKSKPVRIWAKLKLNDKIIKKLNEHQIDFDGNEIEVLRVLSPNLKNKVRINEELVNLNTLQDVFEDSLTIYSQYSVAKFKDNADYLKIIDKLTLDKSIFKQYMDEYNSYTTLKKQLEALEKQQLLKEERKELLDMRLRDFKDIEENVDVEALIAEKKQLDEMAASIKTYTDTSDSFNNLINNLNTLIQMMDDSNHNKLLNDALINIEEVSYDLAKSSFEVDESRLAYITEYISTCKRVARKYNVDITELDKFKQDLELEATSLDSIEADIQDTESKLSKQYEITYKIAKQLRAQRLNIIPVFCEEINKNLKQLSLVESDFQVECNQVELCANGIDECCFKIKMNEGSAYTPIHKTASGGEIARFLLALEAVCSQENNNGFLIFDEIDTGVSGHVASQMAIMMKKISKNDKVLIITHLAQVAAISENHFLISKNTRNNFTFTDIKLLSNEEKPYALAKMISGHKTSDEAIAHAKTLLVESGGCDD